MTRPLSTTLSLLLGLTVILIVIVFPQGIAGFIKQRFGRIVGIRSELST